MSEWQMRGQCMKRSLAAKPAWESWVVWLVCGKGTGRRIGRYWQWTFALKFTEEAKPRFERRYQYNPLPSLTHMQSPHAQPVFSARHPACAPLLDNRTRKLQTGVLGETLGLSLPGSLPWEEPPDCQIKNRGISASVFSHSPTHLVGRASIFSTLQLRCFAWHTSHRRELSASSSKESHPSCKGLPELPSRCCP